MKREDIFDKNGMIIQEKAEKFAKENPLFPAVTEKQHQDFSCKKNRTRYKDFPSRLPTAGQTPLPPDEHVLIGAYEDKQTLYLLLAFAYNVAMDRIDALEAIVSELQAKIKK